MDIGVSSQTVGWNSFRVLKVFVVRDRLYHAPRTTLALPVEVVFCAVLVPRNTRRAFLAVVAS